MDPYFYLVIAAGLIAGASTGFLGVYIVGMRIPFIGTCIAHAAMAGFVYGSFFVFQNAALTAVCPVLGGITASVIAAVSLAAIRPERSRLDTNVGLAVVFCLMMGLTFLGVDLNQGSRSELLGLLWGNILFTDGPRTVVIAVMAAALAAFTALFNKELKVLLFSRSMAAATGMHERFVYCLFLALTGIILAVNLPLIGGLMIFALVICPAAAAYQICTGHRMVVLTSTLLGMLSTLTGFMISYRLNRATGACIAIVSVLIFALAALYRILRQKGD